MSTTVNTGWLHDKNGDKFAPKTLISQVQTNDGTLLEDKIQADIDRVADKIVQSDWNADEDEAGHVLNRTHYVEKPFDSITWNGDIAGKEEIVYNQNKSYYKVSDRILSVDDLLGAICKNSNGSSVTITEKLIMQPNENIIFIKLIGDIFVLSPTTYDGMTFNSSGVYIQRNVYGDYVSYTTEIIARDVVHKLEEKYIPDSIAKVGTAAVGQTIAVKSVDENGKPTEWEAVDYQERTHWVVKGSTPIIAEQEFTFNSSAQSSLSEALNIVDGETYVVVWDGVEYICECKSGTYESYPILYIGNEVVIGKEDDGIPFIFGKVDVSGGISLVACLEPNSTHTAALYPSVVNKIPNRYLPKGIGDSRSVVLLPETTLTFTNSQYQGAHNVLIEPGKTYKVLWNGTEYILTASYFNLGTMAGNGLGNQAAIGGTDTGEPFMLGTNVEGTALICIELTGATSATVSIIGEEITMIPPKYLPDGIGYEIIENVLPATSATYVEDGADKYFYVRLSPELIIGQNYLVDLNGTVYNCTAWVHDGSDVPCLGNATIMGSEDYNNTGEPFCLCVFTAFGKTYIYMEDPIPSFLTVSITSVDRHRIPTKYLPDMVDKDAILAEAKEYADNLKVLPMVTASDNGAFLRVVDGVWAAIQLPNIEEGEF